MFGSYLALKGLKIERDKILSPQQRSVWENGELVAPRRDVEGIHGIFATADLNECLHYAGDVFVVVPNIRDDEILVLGDRGWRSQRARIICKVSSFGEYFNMCLSSFNSGYPQLPIIEDPIRVSRGENFSPRTTSDMLFNISADIGLVKQAFVGCKNEVVRRQYFGISQVRNGYDRYYVYGDPTVTYDMSGVDIEIEYETKNKTINIFRKYCMFYDYYEFLSATNDIRVLIKILKDSVESGYRQKPNTIEFLNWYDNKSFDIRHLVPSRYLLLMWENDRERTIEALARACIEDTTKFQYLYSEFVLPVAMRITNILGRNNIELAKSDPYALVAMAKILTGRNLTHYEQKFLEFVKGW